MFSGGCNKGIGALCPTFCSCVGFVQTQHGTSMCITLLTDMVFIRHASRKEQTPASGTLESLESRLKIRLD